MLRKRPLALVGAAAASLGLLGFCWHLRSRHLAWRARLVSDPQFASVKFVRAGVEASSGGVGFCWLPTDVFRALDGVAAMRVRPTDIYVVSFPKAGTTWLQELVYMLVTGMDTGTAETVSIEDRFPYLEYPYPGLATIAQSRQTPRLIKSHLPWGLLPHGLTAEGSSTRSGAKIIYLARCPKDTAVSYFHFLHMLRPLIGYSGDMRDFAGRFLDCEQRPLPYGPWQAHVAEFWRRSQARDDVMFLTYEQLKADTAGCVKDIARFLGMPQPSDQLVEKIVDFCAFHRMRARPTTSYSWYRRYGAHDPQVGFYRSGRVGGWRGHLTEAEATDFDASLIQRLQDESGLIMGSGTAPVT